MTLVVKAFNNKRFNGLNQKPCITQYRALFLWLLLIFSLTSCESENESVSLSGKTMGTTYHITMVNPPPEINLIDLQQDIDVLLASLNSSFSTYEEQSEISKFNERPPGEWVSVSNDFIEVLEISLLISQLSEGAFDITVGPLVELWGFGKASHSSIPESRDISVVLENIGYNKLQMDKENRRIKKNQPITIDVSAVAKGYAVDRVAALLKERRIFNAMVEIGGEVYVLGVSPRNTPWRLGIESPEPIKLDSMSPIKRNINAAINVSNGAAVATSGDYRNFINVNGKRYSHTINPATGYPVDHSLASVTVIHPKAGEADAWATALLVLGEEKGMAIANNQNLAAYFLQRNEDDSITITMTEHFKPYLDSE